MSQREAVTRQTAKEARGGVGPFAASREVPGPRAMNHRASCSRTGALEQTSYASCLAVLGAGGMKADLHARANGDREPDALGRPDARLGYDTRFVRA